MVENKVSHQSISKVTLFCYLQNKKLWTQSPLTHTRAHRQSTDVILPLIISMSTALSSTLITSSTVHSFISLLSTCERLLHRWLFCAPSPPSSSCTTTRSWCQLWWWGTEGLLIDTQPSMIILMWIGFCRVGGCCRIIWIVCWRKGRVLLRERNWRVSRWLDGGGGKLCADYKWGRLLPHFLFRGLRPEPKLFVSHCTLIRWFLYFFAIHWI